MISNELLKQKILDSAIHGTLIENDLTLPPIDAEEIKDNVPFEIPNNWKWVKLNNIFDVKGGKRIPKGKKFIDQGNHVYIRVADMENMTIKTSNLKFIDDETYNIIKNYIITKNDLYITVAGTIGQVGSVPTDLDNQNLTENANRLIPKLVNKDFYKYVLNSEFYQNIIKNNTTKSAQPKLAIKRINEINLIVPPLEEQDRIVSRIEELSNLIDKKDKNDKEKEKLKTLLKEKILDSAYSGDLISFNFKTNNVEYVTLKDIAHIKARIGWQGLTKNEYRFDGDYFLITGIDFKNEKVDFANCHYVDKERYEQDKNIQLKTGDILITKDGTLGKLAYINELPKPATLNGGVFVVRNLKDYIDNLYLFNYFKTNIFKEFMGLSKTGMTISHLNQKHLIQTLVPLPPLEQQKKIVSKIEELFSLIDKL